MAIIGPKHIEIDDSLYNRQRYVLGDDAMNKLVHSRVLLYGLDGLGVEIAKNIVLAGVKELVLCDDALVTISDIGTQFFLRESDIGKNRADITYPRLAELNPYVKVRVQSPVISDELYILQGFTCVIFVNCLSVKLLESANQRCRIATPPVRFISASNFGVFASVFNDFGDIFEVVDKNDEERDEFLIEYVSQDERGLITLMQHEVHGLETGNRVRFTNVEGMVELNSGEYEVKVTSYNSFRIGDTTAFTPYTKGGVGHGIIGKPIKLSFESFATQLYSPKLMLSDMSKPIAHKQTHLAYINMLQFVATERRMPLPHNQSDFELMVRLSEDVLCRFDGRLVDKPDNDVIKDMTNTCTGCLQPLCATLGGIVAQQALIALTNTFTPIEQWLHLDVREVIPRYGITPEEFTRREDRYDPLRICIGETMLQRLKGVNSFMVGCGAIGCEIMKNIALIGMSTNGQFIVTDDDSVERTNLNNQFLFREKHIKHSKSITACESAVEINPDLRIEAHQNKVSSETEHSHYTDEFYQNQDFVINAVDNTDTRSYIDGRCITNGRPLLESGFMGAKGHVQVIIPFETETYFTPYERGTIYSSIPRKTLQCVKWACDKFYSMFEVKPRMYSQFWNDNEHPIELLNRISQGEFPENCAAAVRLLVNGVSTFKDCVQIARIKFEKYFKHRPIYMNRNPINFNINNSNHFQFVISCAKLLAFRSGIQVTIEECELYSIKIFLEDIQIPEKNIQKYESKTNDKTMQYLARATNIKISPPIRNHQLTMQTNSFNIDDVIHMDFIAAASNLYGEMYSIVIADRLSIKKMAGHIVPAIVTTSATVSGLVTIELIKLVKKCKLEEFRNCSMSLAVPILQFYEPGPVERFEIKPGVFMTAWDRWEIRGNEEMTLKLFINDVTDRYEMTPDMICQKSKLIYMALIQRHAVRLNQPISNYILSTDTENYVDLLILFEDTEEFVTVRYFWS